MFHSKTAAGRVTQKFDEYAGLEQNYMSCKEIGCQPKEFLVDVVGLDSVQANIVHLNMAGTISHQVQDPAIRYYTPPGSLAAWPTGASMASQPSPLPS